MRDAEFIKALQEECLKNLEALRESSMSLQVWENRATWMRALICCVRTFGEYEGFFLDVEEIINGELDHLGNEEKEMTKKKTTAKKEKKNTFKSGDIVAHVCTPLIRMVVISTDNGDVVCEWWDEFHHIMNRGSFLAITLQTKE